MSAAPTTLALSSAPLSWVEANRALLDAELERLRLLLLRRVRWLRRHWGEAAPPDGFGWRITDAEADRLLTGEDRAAEARFHASEACADIAGGLARLGDEIAARRLALEETGSPAALDAIARRFGLGAFARETLLLALAPEIDGGFERLYAYVQDDVGRRHATAHLALTLLPGAAGDPEETDGCLDAQGALRRNRLVVVDDGAPSPARPHRPLRVEERVVEFVLGRNRPDRRVEHLLEPVDPPLLAGGDAALVREIATWLTAVPERLFVRAVNLIGPAGAGKLHLARAACDVVGISLARLDVGTLTAAADRDDLLALLEREAALADLAFFVEQSGPNAELPAMPLRQFERLRALLFVAGPTPWQAQRETLTLAVRRPGALARTELWRLAVADAGLADAAAIAPVVEQFDVEAGEIAATVAAAQARAAARGGKTLAPADLWAACRDRTAPRLDDLAQRIEPHFAWDDIVLPGEAVQQLHDIAAQLRHRPVVYRRWGFGDKLARGQGISALFAGPSGTGKTMAAEILAGELELGLYRIDLAGVVSKYIGETEKNLRRIFDAAEAGGAVLFFDEADALFGKRSEVKDSHDRYANIEVDYLLQRMEDFRGLAILATNRRSALDQAFVRRLRFIVEFPFPDISQRQEIWRKVFPAAAETDGIDYGFLARLEIAGGNIRNVALAAAFLAADAGRPIGMPQLLRAARREYQKMERLVPEAEFAPRPERAAR